MHLFTLLGEQPIPNLIPLWQVPRAYTRVTFVVTSRTLPQVEVLKATIAHDPALRQVQVFPPLVVEAYDLAQARTALVRALEQATSPLYLNPTGGTKIMSLAAQQAAHVLGVPWLYVSTEIGQIIHYTAAGEEVKREPIRVRVSVETYLRAHGLEVSLGKPIGAWHNIKTLPPTPGHTLEEDVHQALVQSGRFDDVQRNVYIRKRGSSGHFIDNELDIMVTYNGLLAVGSCKTGKILSTHLYELSALSRREVAGIYARKALIYRDTEPRPGIRRRAPLDDIALVPAADLNQVVNEFSRLLGQS
ncbi:MAG: hypothetical protein ACPLUL_09235 [Thermanaerothrix sp.]|uniref:hypothetical protein n=1 Tax=Thermanaerothrix sp. TaxID=2972675 RepID=UPI003C7B1AF0